jgi:hypothetical protein
MEYVIFKGFGARKIPVDNQASIPGFRQNDSKNLISHSMMTSA